MSEHPLTKQSPTANERWSVMLYRASTNALTLSFSLLALILLIFHTSAVAQVSLGGSPRSFSKALRGSVPTQTMPAVDVAALLKEDEAEQDKGVPFRFGYGFDVEYSLSNSGVWDTLPDGGRIWRLSIVCPGAYSTNLLYSRYRLPAGADFYIYNADHSMVIGAFTARNNKEQGQFATGLVKGDAVTLEYYEPATVEFPGEITVSRVVHGYKDLFDRGVAKGVLDYGQSGSCNNNVNCPEGAAWQKDKRAVAMILTSGGSRLCTGSMVNNVRQDRTPYFLTANHCLGGESSWIIMFNYESPTCTNQNGPTYMTVQGTSRLANYSTSDFGLLLLLETPPDSYKVYFNGWNAVNTASDSAVCIHHPSGDIKKITFDYDAYTSTDYLGTTINANASHWRITAWNDGTTEPGSSGSPLYDKFHRVIGQLHGGYASCSSITSDYYGKFAMSWEGGGSNSTRLRNWLDPDNTGVFVLSGFDPYAGVQIHHTPLPDTKDSVNAYEVKCTIDTDTTLIPDSLALWYQIAGVWHSDTLTATLLPNEYHGYIPPQTPGTIINYFLKAQAYNGKADTTDTYTFRVIDYAIILTPAVSTGSGAVGDTVWYSLNCKNDGQYSDVIYLTVGDTDWPTTIWDNSGTTPITATPTLAPNAIYAFKARVIIGPSFSGQVDTALVVAKSQGNGTVQKSVKLYTTSAGQPLTLPFVDNFISTTIDVGKWAYNHGATVDGMSLNPPSPPYALRLNGDPVGADTLMSQAINTNVAPGLYLTYAFEQTGGGESPDAGDDLYIEYLNNLAQWQLLKQHLGADPDMSNFANVRVALPLDAYHSAFRLRIRNKATVGAQDDWFVDNIRIDYAANIAVSPLSFNKSVSQGDSAYDRLIISNSGQGGLAYSAVVIPDFSPLAQLFDKLMLSGRVNHYSYPEGWNDYQQVKGDETVRLGPEAVFNAGGPDGWGYIWIDSDEPGGPTYNWIEIEGTGTDITAGLADDNFTGPYTIGFTFPFYDSLYTQFYVASNGFIGFGPTTNYTSLGNTALPNGVSTAPKNIICWCWDDLNILDADSPGGKVLYQIVGGNLVIEFARYPEFDGAVNPGDVITAEIILSPSGSIVLQYNTIAPGFDILGNTVGIQNRLGSMGLTVSTNTNYLHNNLAVQIEKPAQWLFTIPAIGEVPAGQTDTIQLIFSGANRDTGNYKANLKLYSNDPDSIDAALTIPAQMRVLPPYLCGDANGDDAVDISDAVALVAYIFSGGPAPDPLARGDVTCDNAIDISDAVYLVAYIFAGGPAPCAACK